MTEKELASKIVQLVHTIPEGRVLTCMQISVYCGGAKQTAKIIPKVLSEQIKDSPNFPFHRVVKSNGELINFPGCSRAHQQKKLLMAQNVEVCKNKVLNLEAKKYNLKKGSESENKSNRDEQKMEKKEEKKCEDVRNEEEINEDERECEMKDEEEQKKQIVASGENENTNEPYLDLLSLLEQDGTMFCPSTLERLSKMD